MAEDAEDIVRHELDRVSGEQIRSERSARRDKRQRDEEDAADPTRLGAHSTLPEQLTRTARPKARAQSGPRRPAVWAEVETVHSPQPVYGAYPQRFVARALRWMGFADRPNEVLHVCSGALTRDDVLGGTRVDIRPEACPDHVADGRALPFVDGRWGAVMIDPPYSVEYARDLYGTEYPRPSHLLREAARVTRVGGRIGMLHFLVPSPVPGTAIVSVRGVTQGCGYRIRAFTIYERIGEQLLLDGDER